MSTASASPTFRAVPMLVAVAAVLGICITFVRVSPAIAQRGPVIIVTQTTVKTTKLFVHAPVNAKR
jgi:hypothetical protein